MAERKDQQQRGDQQRGGDDEEALQRALEHEKREDLVGQIEENQNLTGSTTYETLPDQGEDLGDAGGESGRKR